MQVGDIKQYMESLKNSCWFDRLYFFCLYFQKDENIYTQAIDQWSVFYLLNEIFGNHVYDALFDAFNNYLGLNSSNDDKTASYLYKLDTINEFLFKNNLWQDIIYTVIDALFDKRLKTCFYQLETQPRNLESFELFFKNMASLCEKFFYDKSLMDGFLLVLNYNIHYFYLLFKLPLLENYLMNKDDNCLYIKELAKCIEETDRRDVLVTKFLDDIAPKVLYIGNSTSSIMQYCNLVLANCNDIDPSGELSTIMCTPIVDYLKTRKDLIKSIVTSISSCETFNEDFIYLNKNNIIGSSWLSSLNTINADPPSDSEDNLCQPLNFSRSNPPKKKLHSLSHDSLFDAKRIQRSAFDLLNSYIFIVGNASIFMEEFSKYLQERILPFSTDEILEREKVLLEFFLSCFGKELAYNCIIMLNDVKDSIANTFKKIYKKKKMTIDCIITTPSVWPDINSDNETQVPQIIKNFAKKIEKDFKARHPTKSLEWFPDRDILEMTVVIHDVKKTFLATPNQGTVLALFNKNVILSYDDLLKKSPNINDMDTIVKVVSHWIQMGVIVSLGDDTFQLSQSFT